VEETTKIIVPNVGEGGVIYICIGVEESRLG
jgi:hypothetical protein